MSFLRTKLCGLSFEKFDTSLYLFASIPIYTVKKEQVDQLQLKQIKKKNKYRRQSIGERREKGIN
jgi:hypothetical protein